jgi:hypothetical protein
MPRGSRLTVLPRERELGDERVRMIELGERVKALEGSASHDQCVERPGEGSGQSCR